ncbi:MAG: ATP-binding protein [Clostridia bacterium]
MKRKIFWSILFASVIIMLLTASAIIAIMYGNTANEVKNEVKAETMYIAQALEALDNSGVAIHDYIISVGNESINRITLISSDGFVMYDNYAWVENLDNHLSRPEVISALETGSGENTRLSDTLGEKTYYYAVKLENGNILRVAVTTKSILGLMRNFVVWFILISICVLIVAIMAAWLLTDTIIKPINRLDPNDPLSNDTYSELSPLLSRMEKQKNEISRQFNEMNEKQKEFDFITGGMSEGLVIFGNNGSVLSANKSAKKILGGDGRFYTELCRDIHYLKVIDDSLHGKPAVTKMIKDNLVYQLSANPVEGRSKSYASVLFIVDITEREKAEKMRREFSANVSHELKTPLTSIMGYAEIISNGIAKKSDIPQFARQIHSEAERLLSVIEDIIKLSRLDEQDLKQEFTNVELSALCRSIITQLTEKASQSGITMTFTGDPVEISGFRPVLHEMIFNLCDNAINYNKPNGEVAVTLVRLDNTVSISVSDTGIGIAPEHQKRVFERFYRVDKSHSKETGGTGLGLSIVKHGAMLHDAEIILESKPDSGTTITLNFTAVS